MGLKWKNAQSLLSYASYEATDGFSVKTNTILRANDTTAVTGSVRYGTDQTIYESGMFALTFQIRIPHREDGANCFL